MLPGGGMILHARLWDGCTAGAVFGKQSVVVSR